MSPLQLNKDSVLDQLSNILDPDLNQDIVSLGFVRNLEINGGDVKFTLALTTPACPIKDQFKAQAERLVGEIPGVTAVSVTMTGGGARPQTDKKGPSALSGVKHIVAVASCKGGVGKSTVAINLALTISKMGAKVGIFDADIYGPSLPTLIRVPVQAVQFKRDLLTPIICNEIKMMSFGFVQDPDQPGPAILRGPIVSQILLQLLNGTDWGELDYLIIDMPPGTGDIQLTLAQNLLISGSVVVTTPQHLSYIDVEKGIQMFDTVNIPTIAVVENMAYFVCDGCQKKHRLFGEGAMARVVREFGIEHAYEIPLIPQIAQCSDTGYPYSLVMDTTSESNPYYALASGVVREVSRLANQADKHEILVSYDESHNTIELKSGESSRIFFPKEIRVLCRCANCENEMNGDRILNQDNVSDSLSLKTVKSIGNYAFGFSWSDSHYSLIPKSVLFGLLAS